MKGLVAIVLRAVGGAAKSDETLPAFAVVVVVVVVDAEAETDATAAAAAPASLSAAVVGISALSSPDPPGRYLQE